MKKIYTIMLIFLSLNILASENYQKGVLDLGLSFLDDSIVVFVSPNHQVEVKLNAGTNVLSTAQAVSAIQAELKNFGIAAAPTEDDIGWVARRARYLCEVSFKEEYKARFGGGEMISSVIINDVKSCKAKLAEDTGFVTSTPISINDSNISINLNFNDESSLNSSSGTHSR